ncbi:DUF4435 domain-containing protein [Alcaligenes sp. SMD-FA]|uniref:DUF4435 domain-containing protein n=1 Tax=Alcaligenes sp. SMD-FA TaxID=2991054 RepID=UPI00222712D3|nr:DUF4435 domain-containing protein [Alcaligenes sp. SMD-FA]UYY87338.1 DUF4435 domain-containing protein [Alcaligenes sp. SMD-FA]
MDYLKKLEKEMGDGNVAFHEYVMNFARESINTHFLFFEGNEDPSFYMIHIKPHLGTRETKLFICSGRAEVLKAYKMVQRDGRGANRSLFFVDKDHNDIMGNNDTYDLNSVYQTSTYSIENYLVVESVFRAYWTQRLHLSEYDARFTVYLSRFKSILNTFRKRCLILTGLILCGRGIGGRKPISLNLSNAQLDKIFRLDWHGNKCHFQKGAGKHFLQSTNIAQAENISAKSLKKIFIEHLHGKAPSTYLRGKYELWLFWKVLRQFSQELGSKEQAKKTGLKRATPSLDLPLGACVESLSALTHCPESLNTFLNTHLSADLLANAS